MWSYLLAFGFMALIFLANDIKCAIMGRWSVFKYSAILAKSKVIAKGKAGKRGFRIVRLPKGAVPPAPGWFRKGAV